MRFSLQCMVAILRSRHTKRQVDGPYLKLPVLVCHVERLLIDRKDCCSSGSCHLYSTTGQTRVSGDLQSNRCQKKRGSSQKFLQIVNITECRASQEFVLVCYILVKKLSPNSQSVTRVKASYEVWLKVKSGMRLPMLHKMYILRHKISCLPFPPSSSFSPYFYWLFHFLKLGKYSSAFVVRCSEQLDFGVQSRL